MVSIIKSKELFGLKGESNKTKESRQVKIYSTNLQIVKAHNVLLPNACDYSDRGALTVHQAVRFHN